MACRASCARSAAALPRSAEQIGAQLGHLRLGRRELALSVGEVRANRGDLCFRAALRLGPGRLLGAEPGQLGRVALLLPEQPCDRRLLLGDFPFAIGQRRGELIPLLLPDRGSRGRLFRERLSIGRDPGALGRDAGALFRRL